MNIVKNILNRPPSGGIPQATAERNDQRMETLLQVRKLFAEHGQGKTDEEKDAKLDVIVPLFCKAFDGVDPKEYVQKFHEIRAFAFCVGRRLAKEVKQRASNQSRQDASKAIYDFFTSAHQELGFQLLKACTFLLLGDPQVIEALCQAALPSTLIKILYLFIDLPVVDVTPPAEGPADHHEAFSDVFVSLLRGMCPHLAVAEELAKTDSLGIVFRVVTLRCPRHNWPWRAAAHDVIVRLATSPQHGTMMAYAHRKGCMAQAVKGMGKLEHGDPCETVEMLSTVFACLRESTRTSRMLLDDFSDAKGWHVVAETVARLCAVPGGLAANEAARKGMETIVRGLAQLVFCGPTMLRPQPPRNMAFQDPRFLLPMPAQGDALSVRNVAAFQCLQGLVLSPAHPPTEAHEANAAALGAPPAADMAVWAEVLDAVFQIFSTEPANYFILEPQHTLALFVERVDTLSPPLKSRVFRMVEYVVCSLNFVPLPELVALGTQLQRAAQVETVSCALATLMKLANFDPKYANVFREVGILDVIVGGVRAVADAEDPASPHVGTNNSPWLARENQPALLECAAQTLESNSANAGVFRKAGGSAAVFSLVRHSTQHRHEALRIAQRLVRDDCAHGGTRGDFSALLEALQHMPSGDAVARADVLRAVARCLHPDDESRHVFRELGGFVNVVSVLLSLEHAFAGMDTVPSQPQPLSPAGQRESSTHDAHADHIDLMRTCFHVLTTALQGCPANKHYFRNDLGFGSLFDSLRNLAIVRTPAAAQLFDMLLDFALEVLPRRRNTFDAVTSHRPGSDPAVSPQSPRVQEPPPFANPEAATVVARLLPLAPLEVQLVVLDRLATIVSSDANMLALAAQGLVGTLLNGFENEVLAGCLASAADAATSPTHALFRKILAVVEAVGACGMTPREARAFFKLGVGLRLPPMLRAAPRPTADGETPLPIPEAPSATIHTCKPLARPFLDALSRMSARGCTMAPHVEFDMRGAGYGCCVVPSLGDQRAWPPPNGLSVCAWVWVDSFGAASEAHPVRIVSFYDEGRPAGGVTISHDDHCAIVASGTPGNPPVRFDRFAFAERRWYHVGVCFTRSRLKGTSVTLFVDGRAIDSVKIAYIPGPASGFARTVSCVVGTHPRDRRQSRLVWRVGQVHVYDDTLTPQQVAGMAHVGPSYSGNYQGSLGDRQTHELFRSANLDVFRPSELYLANLPSPLVPEERIVLGLSPLRARQATLDRIRETTGDSAATFLTNDLGIDGRAPAVVVDNGGAAPPALGVLHGSARPYSPIGAGGTIREVGGMPVIFKLIADAKTGSELSTALNVLANCVRHDCRNAAEMERLSGYHVVAQLMRSKEDLLSCPEVLESVFALVGRPANVDRSVAVISNLSAFYHLLMDYDVWRASSTASQRAVFQHLYDLIRHSKHKTYNVKRLRKMHMVQKLLNILRDETIREEIVREIVSVLSELIDVDVLEEDLRHVGDYLLTTLNPDAAMGDTGASRRRRAVGSVAVASRDSLATLATTVTARKILLRNMLLDMVHGVLVQSRPEARAVEKFGRVLGSKFLLSFVSRTVSTATVVGAVRLLATLLSDARLGHLSKFKALQGFRVLSEVLPAHAASDQLYMLLVALTLGNGASEVSFGAQFEWSSVQQFFSLRANPEQVPLYCPEALSVMIAMARSAHERAVAHMTKKDEDEEVPASGLLVRYRSEDSLNSVGTASLSNVATTAAETDERWLEEHPATFLRFLQHLHRKSSEFAEYASKPEFIDDFVGVLFPRAADLPATAAGAAASQQGTHPQADAASLSSATGSHTRSVDTGTSAPVPVPAVSALASASGSSSAPGSPEPGRASLGSPAGAMNNRARAKSMRERVSSITMSSVYSMLSPSKPTVPSPSEEAAEAEYVSPASASAADGMSPYSTAVPQAAPEVSDFGGKRTARVYVSKHPTAAAALSFLRQVAVDGMRSSKGLSVLDYILEAAPPTTTDMLTEYQTDVLSDVASQFADSASMTALVQWAPRASLCIPQLAMMLVDKVIQGVYLRSAESVFDYIHALVVRLCSESAASLPKGFGAAQFEQLFRALNRALLHRFGQAMPQKNAPARPDDDAIAVVMSVVQTQEILFSPKNTDPEFVPALFWHLERLVLDQKREVRLIVVNALKHLLRQRRQVADEVLRLKMRSGEMVDLYTSGFELLCLDRDPSAFVAWYTANERSVRAVLDEGAARVWRTFEQNEFKAADEARSARFARRTQRLQRHYRREHADAEQLRGIESAIARRVGSVQRAELNAAIKFRQNTADSVRFVREAWNRMQNDLSRERGLFGPDTPSELDKWMLDATEGPDRMRRKLQTNERFYMHYPYDSQPMDEARRTSRAERAPTSGHSERHYHARLHAGLAVPASSSAGGEGGEGVVDGTSAKSSTSQAIRRQQSDVLGPDGEVAPGEEGSDDGLSEGGETDEEGAMFVEADEDFSASDSHRIQRKLEPGDTIVSRHNCVRVAGLDVVDALLLICSQNVYVIDGFCVADDGEILDIDAAGGLFRPVIPPGDAAAITGNKPSRGGTARGTTPTAPGERAVAKWPHEDIVEVHKRRLLLQDLALEVFSSDGRNHLLAFRRGERDGVYSKLAALASNVVADPASEGGLKSNASLTLDIVAAGASATAGLFGFQSLMGMGGGETRSTPTQRWARGEMSNFAYLMHLNTLAGRSYNDLTQYPVFPWVLADYDSDELDLDNPKSFRDLSRPMGMQTPVRAQEFLGRFNSWDDPTGQTPAFHYGTHYSSAMIVASYLIRLEPFTQHFLKLQGGHFDHPDRMFHSVREAWQSASETNMADVKELVPEFFYLPEFLENHNHFHFGTKQTGEELNHVVLPAWAHGSAREFIRKHREALESPFVSARLNEWIDLIFGYKQQGEQAVEARNVFHHLSYEGAVDIDQIADVVQRNATIGIISNFGQTPRQLFKKPHPKRTVFGTPAAAGGSQAPPASPAATDPANAPSLWTVYSHPDMLMPSPHPIRDVRGPVGEIQALTDKIIALPARKTAIPPSNTKCASWGHPDASLRILAIDGDKVSSVHEGLHVGEIACAAFADARTLVTGGSDSVVSIWRMRKSAKPAGFARLANLHGHCAPVTCLAVSRAFSVIVSGSADRTCIVWDLNTMRFVRQLSGHPDTVSAVCISNTSGDILSVSGNILSLWTANGVLVTQKDTAMGSPSPILCCAVSEGPEWDENNVIVTGHQNGLVKMWSCDYFPAPADGDDRKSGGWSYEMHLRAQLATHTAFERKENKLPASVTCVTIAKDQRKLYVGDERGRVFSWTLPDGTGGVSDYWVKDDMVNMCGQCKTRFTFAERRHHCRNCGGVFCGRCSKYEVAIPRLKMDRPVRVCKPCFDHVKGAAH